MALPQDPSALIAQLDGMHSSASVAATNAAAAVKHLTTVERLLCEIYRGSDHARQSCGWLSRTHGQEEHRLDFIVTEKRLKHIKSLLGVSASVVGAAAGYARAAKDEETAYGPLLEALKTLDEDATAARTEGWIEAVGTDDDDGVAAKRAALFDSARWFWALHGKLGDLQYATQDARIEASEASRLAHKCATDSITTIDEAPAVPELAAASGQQLTRVTESLGTARHLLRQYLEQLATTFGAAAETVDKK